MGDYVTITAQQAAERLLSIRCAFILFGLIAILFTIWLINTNRKAERCSLERSKAMKLRVHDQNKAERQNWFRANLELHAQNELLRAENEQYRKTLAMAGVEDVAEFKKWLAERK